MSNNDNSTSADKYRDTVFLPKTEFPMRGELPKREPDMVRRWQDMDLYSKIRGASKGKKKWILHWGPPYANGHAHMGHAFTKCLKDLVNKCWQMSGYDAPMIPGWDCHGLPIEWKIEEKYRAENKNKDDVDKITFRAADVGEVEAVAFAQMVQAGGGEGEVDQAEAVTGDGDVVARPFAEVDRFVHARLDGVESTRDSG
jgi:isoleucyl-tRNA synthetase